MIWPRGTRCARRLHASAVLCFGFAIFLSDALAQHQPMHGVRSPELNFDRHTKFAIWRTTTLGTYKGVDAYRDALDTAGIKVGDSALEILGRPAFAYARAKTEVKLALLSVGELGVEGDAISLAGLYRFAREIGLEICPAEVGPQLRLEYRDQPLGEFLHVAMEPIATYGGEHKILSLGNGGAGLLLIGSDWRPNTAAPRAWRFVFALPGNTRPVNVRTRPP